MRSQSKLVVVWPKMGQNSQSGLRRGWALGVVGMILIGMGQSAWAALLLYEPFHYPTGQQLTLSGSGDPLTVPNPTTTQWDGGVGFAAGSEWGIGRQ